MLYKGAILFVLITFDNFSNTTIKYFSEFDKFRKLKQNALAEGKIGHEYVYDLTGIDECNKSSIRYLGIVNCTNNKKFKILTTFHVFHTSNNNCHGASAIEFYTLKNNIVGKYHLNMPNDLPDELKNNKLIYLRNSKDCKLRKENSIDLSNGLPNSLFLKCSDIGGDMISFRPGE